MTPTVNCDDFGKKLQEWLDGERDALAEPFQAHRRACTACASDYRAALALLQGLRNRVAPSLPGDKIDRLVNVILSDDISPAKRPSQVWRQLALVAAAAACLALAFLIGKQLRRAPSVIQPKTPDTSLAKREQPFSVDQSIADAGSTLLDFSRKSRPNLHPENWLPTKVKSTEHWLDEQLPDPIEPAAQSLSDIRQGAESGLEPMANTARRAFALFTRDLATPSN